MGSVRPYVLGSSMGSHTLCEGLLDEGLIVRNTFVDLLFLLAMLCVGRVRAGLFYQPQSR